MWDMNFVSLSLLALLGIYGERRYRVCLAISHINPPATAGAQMCPKYTAGSTDTDEGNSNTYSAIL